MTPKKKVSGLHVVSLWFFVVSQGFFIDLFFVDVLLSSLLPLLTFWCLFSFVDVCFDDAGMQSSLLGLALANNFFEDPLVGLPPAVSVSTISLP
jgi:hypothetical protein